MVTLLKNWRGKVVVNGTIYDSIDDVLKLDAGTFSDGLQITLYPEGENPPVSVQATPGNKVVSMEKDTQYIITVRPYMTKPSTTSFTFMRQWNNDIPMPMVTMVGTKVKETQGMVYMKLHGEAMPTTVCMKCGRELTNPVSQFFGIGPECGGHNYEHPFETDEEFQAAFADMKKKLAAVTWEGWIIKSAIIRQEVFEDGQE